MNKGKRTIEVKGNKNRTTRHERTGMKTNASVSPSLCYPTSLAKVPSVVETAYIHPTSPYQGLTKQCTRGELLCFLAASLIASRVRGRIINSPTCTRHFQISFALIYSMTRSYYLNGLQSRLFLNP
jgi:hypothetical protein